MPAPANLIHELSTTTGTGNFTLANANGKNNFNDAFGTGGTDVFDYFISHQSAAEWERGTGSMSDATTLVRDTVIESTNSDAAVDFSAGTKDVTNDVPALDQVRVGKQTIWIPASAMLSATTSGPASAQFETTTNDINFKVLDFDTSADEHAHFNITFPKSWNGGTVTFQVWWTTTATDTDGVAWGLQGVAISDNEASDASWGTAIVVTDDAQSAAGEILVTSESAAVTIAGTPAEGDVCFFRVFRDVSDAQDDMTEDARLIGLKLFFTTNSATDA